MNLTNEERFMKIVACLECVVDDYELIEGYGLFREELKLRANQLQKCLERIENHVLKDLSKEDKLEITQDFVNMAAVVDQTVAYMVRNGVKKNQIEQE